MRVIAIIGFVSALVSLSSAADAPAEAPRKLHLPAKFLEESVRPATADEAVTYIVTRLSADERLLFLSTPADAVGPHFHLRLGTGIRNQFGLWGNNAALSRSLGPMHPEDLSGEIIRRVWVRVRDDAGPEVTANVDAIHRTLRSILLPSERYQWSDSPLKDKHRLTTVGDLVADLNAAAAEFFSRVNADEFVRIRFEAAGTGVEKVWIRNGRLKPMSTLLEPQSGAEILGRIGPPPFGRHFVLYEGSVVRIFGSEAIERKK